MKTDEIRNRFLKYFNKQGHTVVASDSLIPQNDPTLLFTGAGMNQFKEYFLGIKKDFSRATSSQKCLRTGDLENVGRTAYHHTFFEMLGNFSFGDYFKEEAIVWAWDFLTNELHIPAERLRVSVHRDDEESFVFWREKVGLSESVIHRFGDKDNFWPSNAPSDGPNGPCGPCSEIFFDQGADFPCSDPDCSPACDCGRFAEIWNLVFTQYERQDGGVLVPLPSKNIDTGMGLERIACVMQGKKTNFEIDIFQPIIDAILNAGKLTRKELIDVKSSVYAITDHVRTAVFTIADGAYPSNEGRGYVVRKLIRRSVWHSDTIGIKRVYLHTLVPIVLDIFGAVYPELVEHKAHVLEIVEREESRFRDTLADGRKLLDDIISAVQSEKKTVLPGADVFRLYDTYGFPDELTRMKAEQEGMTIDQDGFNACMAAQREKAKNATEISSAIFTSSEFEKFIAQFGPTDFRGYAEVDVETKVVSLYVDEKVSASIESGQRGIIILDATPFYAESGGQIGDTGTLKFERGAASVISTQKKDSVFYHEIEVTAGTLNVNDAVSASVDVEKRNAIMRNHTATHILQAALRSVLGEHVRQLGSLVSDEKLRFDFSYPKALTAEQKNLIEIFVNEKIQADLSLVTEETSVEKAKEKGALAFFGDRYGATVRLVSIDDVSKELCGGTHCERTGVINKFTIATESSIASGIRRIEALTDAKADAYLQQQDVKKQEEAKKQDEKKQKAAQRKQQLEVLKSNASIDEILSAKIPVADYSLISNVFQNVDQGGLREIFDAIKTKVTKSVVVLFAENDDSLAIVVALTKDLSETSLSAGDIVKQLNAYIDGKGGGKKLMAFSGGKAVPSTDVLVEKLPDIIKAQIQ